MTAKKKLSQSKNEILKAYRKIDNIEVIRTQTIFFQEQEKSWTRYKRKIEKQLSQAEETIQWYKEIAKELGKLYMEKRDLKCRKP